MPLAYSKLTAQGQISVPADVRRAGRFTSEHIHQTLFPAQPPTARTLAEVIWVLDTLDQLSPSRLATAIEMLLNHKSLTIAGLFRLPAAGISTQSRSSSTRNL